MGTYFFLYVIVGILSTGAYLTLTQPNWQAQGNKTWQELVSAWPEDFTLTYKDETLSASPSSTIKVGYPSGIPLANGLPSSLLTLNTQTTERPTENDSLIVVTSKELGTLEQPGTYHWLPLSQVFEKSELTVDRTFIEEQTPAAQAFISFALKLVAVLVFVSTAFLLPLVRLAVATIFTVFTPSIFRLFDNTKDWKAVWKVGIVLLPLAELAQLIVANLTRPNSLHVFWIIWLLMIVLVNVCNPKRIR